jgi:hypothetical protein
MITRRATTGITPWLSGAAVLLAVATTLIVEPALARRFGTQIDLLRLEGRLGAPRPDDKGTEDLTLQDGRDELHFQLTDLRVMNSGRLAGDVLAAVRPYRPTFYLRGPDELKQKLRAAGENDRLTIMGYRRLGSRDLMVSGVEVVPAAPAP